ncbi:MAG: sulfatase [Acidobacteria bacterium]|nr:sulfatase [Acidobacteriota bacterium]
MGVAAAPLLAQRRKAQIGDKNVLFIVVDDLRPTLRCYGDPDAITPNIDRLAADGLTFTRAYCQQAVCSPSRTSMMTGLRPDTTGVHDLETHFRRFVPNAVTLPQHFRKYGYKTTAFGKIFHKPELDDFPSWSEAPWIADNAAWGSAENAEFVRAKWDQLEADGWKSTERFYFEPDKRTPAKPGERGWNMLSWEARAVEDDDLADGKAASAAIAALRRLKGERFFMGVGFLKPHLPFRAPKKYFDLYKDIAINGNRNPFPPAGAPRFALHNNPELRGYSDIPPDGPIPGEKGKELLRAYYACVSYMDAQVGRLLDALDELGLADSTAVVLVGDHGYHLGEHGLWNKQTNFENAVRTPLIVRYPGQRGKGRKTSGLTELTDIYPSLCQICRLPIPDGLEGSTFGPLFEDPERIWKRAVFSQYPREIPGIGPGMGYSMRTNRFRYTEWRAPGSPYKSVELYDYVEDPYETENIASQPRNASLVNGLSGMLQEGWRNALPPTDPRSGSS